MTSNASSGRLREAMSCSVCRELYEKAHKTPLSLPCGHTFCRPCLVTLRGSGHIKCPSCKGQHNVQVETLAVNYSLLNIMPLCAELKYEECTTHCDDLRYWCSTCGQPLCSLCLHSGHPQGHSVKLTQVFLRDEKLRLKEKLRLYCNLQHERSKLRSQFNILDISVKDLFRKNADMHNTAAKHNELHAQIQEANDITSIKDLEKAVEKFCPVGKNLSLSGDKPMAGAINDPKEASKLAQAATLGAQKQEPLNSSQQTQQTTQSRGALMDFRDGRLLLHSLAEPDSASLYLQMPSEVFLELSVGDRRLGCVYISLWSHMRLAQQFLALCMGTMGPSLLGFKAHGRVRNVIVFRFGDGGAQSIRSPLLTNLEWGGQCRKPEAEGYIMKIDNNDGLAFGICTKKIENVMLEAPFGEVVAGLEVTRNAFLYKPLTEVIVTHCGLAMPRLPLAPSESEVLFNSAHVSSQSSSSFNSSKTRVPTDQNCQTQ